jgi:hypothetical protein
MTFLIGLFENDFDVSKSYTPSRSKFWYNPKLNDVIFFSNQKHHTEVAIDQFDLEMELNAIEGDADDDIINEMIDNGWVRGHFIENDHIETHLNLNGKLRDVRRTLKWALSTFGEFEYLVMDVTDDPSVPTYITSDQFDLFVRKGIRKRLGESQDYGEIYKSWYNTATGEYFVIDNAFDYHHSQWMIDHGYYEGNIDVPLDSDVVDRAVLEGWVRIRLDHSHMLDAYKLNIHAFNYENAKLGYRALKKHARGVKISGVNIETAQHYESFNYEADFIRFINRVT